MTTATQLSPIASAHIAVMEAELEIRDYLRLALAKPGCVVDFLDTGTDLLSSLENTTNVPSLLILDLSPPYQDGIATLQDIRERCMGVPVIVLAERPAVSQIADVLGNTGHEVLVKPVPYEQLRQAVARAIAALSPNGHSIASGKPEYSPEQHNWMRRVEPLIRRIASSEAPVLIQGETGVGKEVLARQIHRQSTRAEHVFLKINCAALPSELLESELFGFERGAFTGALKTNAGKFELAEEGTILLDEIGDLDIRLQGKLLQVLQDREFLKLGAKEPTRVNVRIMAATHHNLEENIEKGEFREDLYHRLNVVNIVVPPLRERTEEILPLAISFLKKHATAELPALEIPPSLRSALLRYVWSGNVRELESTMRRYLVLRDAGEIIAELDRKMARRDGTGPQVAAGRPEKTAPPVPKNPGFLNGAPLFQLPPPDAQRPDFTSELQLSRVNEARVQAEREVITQALDSTRWNRKRAAAMLGTDYKALLYKMKKLGIG